jgi:hypothetical protein
VCQSDRALREITIQWHAEVDEAHHWLEQASGTRRYVAFVMTHNVFESETTMKAMMNYRVFALSAIAMALFVVSAPAFAATALEETTHDGKVVSITSSRLVVANQEGRQFTQSVLPDAKVTLDGKACKAADLKVGTMCRVTTLTSNPNEAICIEAIDKKETFENTHDGKVVSIMGGKLVMTNKDGQEHSHSLLNDAKLTLDGKACKASDLKPGTKIRVTTQPSDPKVAIDIEAIDKNDTFANTHDGTFVSITSGRLVMTNKDGQEHSASIADYATVTLDGKACEAKDLKAGMSIRVTTKKTDEAVVTGIEAIDKSAEYAQVK